MMHFKAYCIATAISLSCLSVKAQTKCSYAIDSAKILANENLPAFISQLQRDTFTITNDKKDIPKTVKKELHCLIFKFKIANPNEFYNPTDMFVENVPRRQITFLAKSKNLFVMRYLLGGIGISAHVLLVKLDGNKITDLWTGYCDQDIKTISDLVDYLQLNKDKEGELHTNVVYF